MVRSVGRQSESAKGVETLIEGVEKCPERDPCECERVRSEIEYFEVVRRETIVQVVRSAGKRSESAKGCEIDRI
jgi:hypothetical protein